MSFKFLSIVLVLVLAGCGATRPPGPPVGTERVLPWGAVSTAGEASSSNLEGRLDAGLDRLLEGRAQGEPYTYRILALSGGGSRGAFGAGFLAGWGASGDRPRFDVVTGISTGALMSTFVFLGPDYDDRLRLYARTRNEDLYVARSPLRGLSGPSIHDTAPMRALIESMITESILDAVAVEHAAGRRLFAGTSNLETGQFTIWDLGAIAASGRPERTRRYHDVLMAAAAFPVMFPPVYIPVEIDGEEYWEAHVDGAARAAVFARAFMLDVEDLVETVEAAGGTVGSELYVVHNGKLPGNTYTDVRPRVASVAERSVSTMLDGVSLFSGDALFRMAMFTGTDYWSVWIPSSAKIPASALDFDPEAMGRLFELGHAAGLDEERFFVHHTAPVDPADLLKVIDPDESFELDVRRLERASGVR